MNVYQSPEEDQWERVKRLPRVLRGYRRDIQKHEQPLDSGLPDVLAMAAEMIEALIAVNIELDKFGVASGSSKSNPFAPSERVNRLALISEYWRRETDKARKEYAELRAAIANAEGKAAQ